MTRALRCGILCVLIAAAGAPAASAAQAGRLAAVVAGRPITVRELANELRVRNVDPAKASRQAWQSVLDSAIGRAALIEQARREKVDVSERQVRTAVAGRRRGPDAAEHARRIRLLGLGSEQEAQSVREQLLIEALLSRKLGAKLFISPKAMVEWYEKNKDLLAGPEVRIARVMTVRAGPTGDAAAKTKIAGLRRKVLLGGDFAELARKHSAGPWAGKGGLLDPMSRNNSGNVFAERVFQLKKPGDVTDIFVTAAGLHFLKLEAVRPGEVPAFKEVQGRIRRRLGEKLRAKHITELAQQARRKTTVRVFWHNISWQAPPRTPPEPASP